MDTEDKELEPTKPLKKVKLYLRHFLLPKELEIGAEEINSVNLNYTLTVCGFYRELYRKYPSLKLRKNYDPFPVSNGLNLKLPVFESFDEQVLFLKTILNSVYEDYIDRFKKTIQDRTETWRLTLDIKIENKDPSNDEDSIINLIEIFRSNVYDAKGNLVVSDPATIIGLEDE